MGFYPVVVVKSDTKTIRRNTQITHLTPTKQSTKNYTYNKGHTTHNEYNYNYNKYNYNNKNQMTKHGSLDLKLSR
jgi:hypothetical protein